MSHATAYVRFDSDGLIVFAEYDGNADMLIPRLYHTLEEHYAGWRKSEACEVKCSCDGAEPAVYANTYADGQHGPVMACRRCMVITSVDEWNADQREYRGHLGWVDGLPEWTQLA